MEIQREEKELRQDKDMIEQLNGSKARLTTYIRKQIEGIKETFGPKTELGKRRTQIGKAPEDIDVPVEALIEKEDITVLCSSKGWIRTMKGHLDTDKIDALTYKDGDSGEFVLH